MFTQNIKFKTNHCSVFLVLILTVAFLFLVGGGLIVVPSVQETQNLGTDHAKVQASAFDAAETFTPTVISDKLNLDRSESYSHLGRGLCQISR